MPAATLPPPQLNVLPPAVSAYHRARKRIHLLCFFIFCALPFSNLMRFDLPRQRFYFAGFELWINEFAIIFFALMFLLFLVVGASLIYGRVYCSYLCPQMIFSEAALTLEAKLRKYITKYFIDWNPARRILAARVAFHLIVGVSSVFLAFVFISYFVEPADLFNRLRHFDLVTTGGIAGAVTTFLTYLDFAFLRQKFCTTVCPYGYLQGMLADQNTLLVQYRDEGHTCIECKKCVRICHMGIDIRDGAFQMECIHCGECIDACDEVLARLHKPGLIHYAWGEKGGTVRDKTGSLLKRLGILDIKRGAIVGILTFYAAGLLIALTSRHSVLVNIHPDRAMSLYKVQPNGEIANHFRYSVSNRGSQVATLHLSVIGLPKATVVFDREPLQIRPGQTETGVFDVVAPNPGALVSHFTFNLDAAPEHTKSSIDMTFLTPEITPSNKGAESNSPKRETK